MSITTFESLVYPLEMRPENFYPEAMCFTIKKRIGLSLKAIEEETGNAFGAVREKIVQQQTLTEKYRAAIKAISGTTKADQTKREELTAKFNEDADKLGVSNLLVEGGTATFNAGKNIVKRYHKEKGLTTERNIGHIYLNMPQAIAYDDSISWDAKPMGALGAVMDAGIGNAAAAGAVGAAGNIAGAGIGAMLGGLVGKLGLTSVGVGAFLGGLAGGTAQNALSATLGMTSNPYEEMMFSGITFRTFNFDFVFRPESADEITVVDTIIKAFRQYSRPSFQNGTLGKTVMNYPMEYNIEFLTADTGNTEFKGEDAKSKASGEVYKRNEHLPLIKTCVCEKVSTNYTPQSVWAAYNSGAPVAISLSLGFKETELVVDTDVEEGY